jgi:hypothetical protein
MGEATGHGNTHGFAEPEKSAVHTPWSWDNHEPVHVQRPPKSRGSSCLAEGGDANAHATRCHIL